MKRIICVLSFICFPFIVFAQYFYTSNLVDPYILNSPGIVSRAAVLVDATTGTLLYSKNMNSQIPPASLTKLMTMHLAMKEIKAGRASYDELIPITTDSWAMNQPPHSSLMFLEPGQTVTLREILLGLAVPSGNDAAVAAALRFAPTMWDFAILMTQEARRMGLKTTRFIEASGYSRFNITTANEFAYFCYQYIRLHPASIKDFHSVLLFAYPLVENVAARNKSNPRTIIQYNRNSLLWNYSGVEGLKTGYITESGYNIALSAERYNNRFILVLLGAPSRPGGEFIREIDCRNLLDWAFGNFKTVRPEIGPLENVKLWMGREETVRVKLAPAGLASSADFTSPMNRANKISYKTVITGTLVAPLPENFPVGYLVISDEYGEVHRVPLVTDKAYKKGGSVKRFFHSIFLKSK